MLTCIFENGVKTSLRHIVVHGLIMEKGKLLLVKRAGSILESGKWSLPSGFLERDETAAECIVREVKEETGWDTEVIKLFKINTSPGRPKEDRQNVALEFTLKPLKQTGLPDKESSEVEWIPFDKLLPWDEFAFDHGETIKQFLDYIKKPFPLPIFI